MVETQNILNMKEITKYFKSMKQEGMTLVISTHQFEDVIELLDEISVLSKGTDVMAGEAWSVFGRSKELASTGIKPPIAISAANAFRQKGWPIPENVVSAEQLIDCVKSICEGGTGE